MSRKVREEWFIKARLGEGHLGRRNCLCGRAIAKYGLPCCRRENEKPDADNHSQPFSPGEGSVPALRERGRVCNAAVSLAQTDVSRDFRIFVTVFSGYRVVGVLGS